MKKKRILEISKTGTDFNLVIPEGTTGRDIEIGLATAIDAISKHQQELEPNFKTETLLEAIKGWIKCLQ